MRFTHSAETRYTTLIANTTAMMWNGKGTKPNQGATGLYGSPIASRPMHSALIISSFAGRLW